MELSEMKADLSVKMLELEAAIDLGMPYAQIKKIYQEIKDLQLQIVFAELSNSDNKVKPETDDLVIE